MIKQQKHGAMLSTCHVQHENNFAPDFPSEVPDIIYLCFPNNPTGSTITKDQLQGWVDYANKNGCVIIYDAAYEAYISQKITLHIQFMNVKVQEHVRSN